MIKIADVLMGKPLEKIESMEILSMYTGKSEKELEQIIIDSIDPGFFILNKERFVVRNPTIVNPKKARKKTRNNIDLYTSNEIKDKNYEKGEQYRLSFFIDGEKIDISDLAKLINRSKLHVYKITEGLASLTINDRHVEIKRVMRSFLLTVEKGEEKTVNVKAEVVAGIIKKGINNVYVYFQENKVMYANGYVITKQDKKL